MFGYRSILREQPRPTVIRESRRAPWFAVGVVCFGAFMGQLDASIVVVAGRYLLPRTRQFSPPGRFDGPGTVLLVIATSALLLALSAVSGLSLPAWLAALLAVLALAAAAAFIRRETRTGHPLIPVRLLRSRPLALGLAGAACGYLALFGPLVVIPQVLAHGPGGTARAGLLLSALPLGFGLAALLGDLVLPETWGDRRRALAGALLTCAVMGISIVIPVTQATVVPQLALAGVGLGIFVPANNTVIMRGIADSSASLVGGLVNMARGIGTTFGISLMALAWHLGSSQAGHGYPGSGQARPAFAVLAVVAAAAAMIALASRARGRGQRSGPERRTRQVGTSEGNLTQRAGQDQAGPDRMGTDQAGGEQIGPELANIVSRLRRAMRRAARTADPALGLSVAQLELLSCITENPGIRPSQLARLLRLAPSSVATLLGGLQSAGYVTRTPGADSDGDRRTVSLNLSEAGAQAVSQWHRVNEDIIQAALAALPHRDRGALRDAAPALRDLTASIDAQAD